MERQRDRAIAMGEREAYRLCKRKKKLKSGRAGRLAGRYNQKKYHCPICQQWHLMKGDK